MNLRKPIIVTLAATVLGSGLAVGGTANAAGPASATLSGQSAAAACNYYTSGTTLTKTGQTGDAAVKRIKQVQCLINYNTSYPTWLEEDGKFGQATYNAVKAVQQKAGIQVDGEVGPNTWSKLRAGVWW
ncbi:peptidoglycan-binding protein [Streptomyces sp. NBC_00335]|uniref:peptidoglycan-binding domain-containing protein n=1 Tax=unclassified Streptomyces TaxID=2593676 RepID=UPI00224D91AF|nr:MULTISPECIES: peptidoglycan-binding protein [unclassified Streptomyces]MCX5409357.1 peptidoglycan-binding protein [Streptomyces sp. NBC_00086]